MVTKDRQYAPGLIQFTELASDNRGAQIGHCRAIVCPCNRTPRASGSIPKFLRPGLGAGQLSPGSPSSSVCPSGRRRVEEEADFHLARSLRPGGWRGSR